MRLTAAQALSLSQELAQEVVDRESKRLANPYDADSYVWKSHDKVGNTLEEILQIRAQGFPNPPRGDSDHGYLHYREYQYEGLDGFLKGSHPYIPVNSDFEDSHFDMFELLSLAPEATQEETLAPKYDEVMHRTKGRGFLVEVSEDGVRVFFMELPTSTPSCRVGANVKWVKRENLI